MRNWRSSKVPLTYAALLRCASWLVPGQQRREWSAEWRSELWYVRQSCAWQPAEEALETDSVMAFCLGAFQDAWWLRTNSPASSTRPLRLQTARHCAALLALLAAASVLVALLLPGVRKVISRAPVANADHLVLISREGYIDSASPTISVEEYQAWKRRAQSLFTDFAFYRPLVARISIAHRAPVVLSIAQASNNLFSILNTPYSAALEDAKLRHQPALVVSQSAWHKSFQGDPQLIGRVLEVAGQQATVVAILPDDSWRLPERMDAWLLEDDSHFTALPSTSLGFVVGHIKKLTSETSGRWHMWVYNGGGYDGFDCVALNRHVEQPFATFLFTLLLACLALPATTPLPLGDYPATDDAHGGSARKRRWMFLLMKIGLIVPIVYCGSMSMAFFNPSTSAASSEYIEFATSFLALLFSFRWALRDQRRRCPVCLRLLSHPARVGHPSRNFLAWHGTEFMCGEGHGLLHVPEIATTWFSTQRWLYLDPSWKGLFPEPYLPSAGLF